jgi:predicted DNA-binding transcriptional regulator YafY/class 3 adenylate cyclase
MSASEPSRPATRLLAMLEVLQARGRVSGRELAERLEVDPRTIRRYAVKLEELGIPVEAERGPNGGYRLRPGHRLPPLMFTDDEATAVVLGLVAARQTGITTQGPGVDDALTKILRVLPSGVRDRVAALEESLTTIWTSKRGAPPATEVALTLAVAIRTKRRVRITYATPGRSESRRVVAPYGLVLHSGRWYLAGHDDRSDEIRTFRLDRVVDVEMRPERASPPEGFDASAHVARSIAEAPWGIEIELVFQTTLEEAQRRIPRTIGEPQQVQEGVLLHARTNDVDAAAREIARLGWPFTVRRPEELRTAVKKLAKTLTRSIEPEKLGAVARSYSTSEVAAEAGVPEARIAWLASIGLLNADERGSLTFGAVFAVKMVSALLDAGLPETTVERAAAEGWLDFRHIDDYLPHEPGLRSDRNFAEVQSDAGPRGSLLPAVYEVLGLPKPDPSRPLHVDEEAMWARFLEGWRLASDDDSLLRAARLIAEGTRAATLGWVELLDEQIAAPARERLLRGEVTVFPDEARVAFTILVRLVPEMFSWLSSRYLEQRSIETIVEGFEQFLASRDLAPMPEPHALPAIVFVDLSGFTKLIEERGDETAVRTATSLQREADAIAARHGGRLVKLLGDGAMLWLPEPTAGVDAALDLVQTMRDDAALLAHAGVHTGSVIQRDLDVFGRTVNFASRIADAAQPGEVLASSAVADAADERSHRFESLEAVSLKGFPDPVPLFRVTRADVSTDRP